MIFRIDLTGYFPDLIPYSGSSAPFLESNDTAEFCLNYVKIMNELLTFSTRTTRVLRLSQDSIFYAFLS